MIEYTVKVWSDGTRSWWLDNEVHRTEGPAVEWASGHSEFWLKGIRMTEAKHKAAMNPVVEEMTMEEICAALGKTVKVIK